VDGKERVGGMTDFLLELRSEEIPARMQGKAKEDLARLFTEVLAKAGLVSESLETFATPRRLALIAKGLPLATEAVAEETKGPKVGAPPQAMEGFLRKVGLTQDQLVERDGVYFAVVEKAGRNTADVLGEAIPAIIRAFPWPKSQRWGAASVSTESLRWVRPLKGIVALLGDDVVPCEIDGIASGAATMGHRFHHSGEITIGNAGDYIEKLRVCHVIVHFSERCTIIRDGAKAAAEAAGLTLVEDEGLVVENAGLTEWPVPMLGRFDPEFLEVPEEVIQLTARVNQKYFVCQDANGKLANAFVCTANIVANDGGAAIVAGNEKVLAARLSDAKFFWEQDLKVALDEQAKKLSQITFHEKLGTVAQRHQRFSQLVNDFQGELADSIELAREAAVILKADLVTGMVGEFPELQGIMGGYYALAEGRSASVAAAVTQHYKPAGPTDVLPSDDVAVIAALIDKIDALVGFFGSDLKPTGSKDPFALRRAALGVVRLITERGLRLRLGSLFHAAAQLYRNQDIPVSNASNELLDFFADRLKVQQREAGVRHDLIDAVFALGGEDDLVRLLARVKALQAFVATEEGVNLLAGYKRAANILKAASPNVVTPAEAGVSGRSAPTLEMPAFAGMTDLGPEEAALLTALDTAEPKAAAAVDAEDFEGAMAALASLRAPIDAFFEGVMVNDPDPAKRAFRLGLLARFRDAVHRVADFSKIEG
jgi:glycyl-tRNA synthetase beta chain